MTVDVKQKQSATGMRLNPSSDQPPTNLSSVKGAEQHIYQQVIAEEDDASERNQSRDFGSAKEVAALQVRKASRKNTDEEFEY